MLVHLIIVHLINRSTWRMAEQRTEHNLGLDVIADSALSHVFPDVLRGGNQDQVSGVLVLVV